MKRKANKLTSLLLLVIMIVGLMAVLPMPAYAVEYRFGSDTAFAFTNTADIFTKEFVVDNARDNSGVKLETESFPNNSPITPFLVVWDSNGNLCGVNYSTSLDPYSRLDLGVLSDGRYKFAIGCQPNGPKGDYSEGFILAAGAGNDITNGWWWMNIRGVFIDDPVANDDFYIVTEGTNTTPGSVLENDVAGPDATVGKVFWNGVEYNIPADGFKLMTPLGGGVVLQQDGTFLYASPVRYNSGIGIDTDGSDVDNFKYRVKSADGSLSDPATVYITILDTVPVAEDDVYTLGLPDVASGFSSNVMGNDILSKDWITTGANGIQNIVWQVRADDSATPVLVPAGAYDQTDEPTLETALAGKVWIDQNGNFEYVAPSSFSGGDSFQYRLTDGDNSPSNWATVTFNVPDPCADGHDFIDDPTGEDYVDPTCTEPGVMPTKCSVCDESGPSRELPATGHDYLMTEKVDATCEADGYELWVCQNDAEHFYTVDLKATGHDYLMTEKVDATCEADGYELWVCQNDAEHFYTVDLKATGHDWNKGVVTVKPTAHAEGTKVFTCKTCGETYSVVLPKLTVNGLSADASVEKLNGNKNNLTITITELVSKAGSEKQSEVTYTMTFSIDNNAAGIYEVGPYQVYVNTKGNTQIREIYIVE